MDAEHKPSIVHVVNSLAPGGMERALVQMLHAWGPDHLRHAVVTLRAAGPLAAQLPDHTACRPLHAAGPSRSAWWRLAGELRRQQPAVIHARGIGTWCDAVLASLLLPSARMILGFHGWDRRVPVSTGARWAARFARRHGAHILTIAERARVRLAHEIGLAAADIDVIPNGVDNGRFMPADPQHRAAQRSAIDILPDQLAVGIVGSLTSIKRHDLLLDAFASVTVDHPSLVLLIAGEGPLRGPLESRATALGMSQRVRFLGQRDDLPAVLPALDAYVCASDSEGQSNALLEALACGLPVITTDVGDHAALLKEQDTGIVVPCAQPMALAGALRRLCASPELRQEMGKRARQVAKKHDVRTMADRYSSLYRSLVPGFPAAAPCAQPSATMFACVP